MRLQRWDYDRHEYLPFDSPARVLIMYSDNMKQKCDCASCGKRKEFGDFYTSKEIHNHVGFGYPVCEDCYNKELKRWKEHRDDEPA